MSTHNILPLTHGATVLGPDRTRFRFWAPDCDSVTLELEDATAVPMQTVGEGWFEAEAGYGAGTRYRYRIADGTAVPDPAARAQDGDISGASLVVDPARYTWRNTAWRGRPWHEAVIYEVHPGLVGGFQGLAEQLPRLAALGITAIELMPIAEFPGNRNWGYDGVLPFAPEASYGTPDDLKALIDRGHDLGLMMFQDVVYNHFGPEGNYLHSYASGFFRDDVQTPWGAAIDFKNPVVRRFFIENALYWLEEFQFDGLRLDAVHAIPDRDWLEELAATVHQRYAGTRAVHLVLENDNNDAGLLEHSFTAQWNDDAHHAVHVLISGENEGYYSDYAGDPAAKLARCLGEGFAFQGEASEYRDGERRGQPSGHLPPDRFVFFLQNHDQVGNRAFGERLAEIARPEVLKVGVAALLLSPQIPLIFMGEEIGARKPFLYFAGYEGDLAKAVRDGRRKEFGKFAAFSTPEAQKRIPDPNAEASFHASAVDFAASDDWSESWRRFYRTLITLRREKLVPRLAGARSAGAEALSKQALRAAWLLADGARLSLFMNFGAEAIDCALPQGERLFELGMGAGHGVLPGAAFVAIIEPKP
jgi:malto-oligosyltrehalose trehalohydrolase